MTDCGSCNLCCLLLDIKSLSKPAHILCWNTGIHGGCKVQESKGRDPLLDVCAGFACIWLQSQSLDNVSLHGSRSMRPDQCHVMFVRDPTDLKLLWVHVDPKHRDSWREPAVANYLDEVLSKGARLKVIIGDDHFSWPGEAS
jgi:hypothetical protein